MEQAKIDRINELARKAKTPEGLTPEETAERTPCAVSTSTPTSRAWPGIWKTPISNIRTGRCGS